jgi:predicted transposase YbfD/YdcC
MAIDGKTMKGSHNRAKGLGPMHMVSAWLSEFGLTLAQVATDVKSNEITAIPELLKLIDLNGSIITIDAMGTQVAIAEQIVEGKGDYILALKACHWALQNQQRCGCSVSGLKLVLRTHKIAASQCFDWVSSTL